MDIDRVKEVKIAVIRRGWNQGDLADSLGISQSYLSLLLKGRKEAPWIWKRIDEKLGITGTGEGAGARP